VIALERRDGRVSVDLREWTDLHASGHLIVAGTDSALARFDERR
jgi:hypothetical protein